MLRSLLVQWCLLFILVAVVDYLPVTRVISFLGVPFLSQQSSLIGVSIVGDTNVESDETFSCVLSSPQPATSSVVLQQQILNITILDDDGECGVVWWSLGVHYG
jgi:hypothetical protein